MGNYLNPGNEKFRRMIQSEIYVDKTGMIKYTNSVLDTAQNYVCVSRPRRFGKSMAANMLTAYYSRGCNSKELFGKFEIAKDKDFEKYLYFSSDKVECCDIEKHKLFEIDNEDFYEVDLSLKQKVVCMLVTTRNQQYSFECKQDARFLQIIDLFKQKKIRYIDRNHFISIKR